MWTVPHAPFNDPTVASEPQFDEGYDRGSRSICAESSNGGTSSVDPFAEKPATAIQKSILRDVVADLSLHYLVKAKFLVIKDVERTSYFYYHIVKISGIRDMGKTTTVLVRGSNLLVLDEGERSLHDALCVEFINDKRGIQRLFVYEFGN
ncbi:T-complex protein 1 subunit delta, putative [Medicago truncatula]|uniref:T-complex protein 1 subunit delta, putative n=1 Tax=Medicago truncatula TaxID=3880 RepID=G7JM74_MEDTR|nr:T-complex protein 1 subunit delta, putative [Medicago truncatula]